MLVNTGEAGFEKQKQKKQITFYFFRGKDFGKSLLPLRLICHRTGFVRKLLLLGNSKNSKTVSDDHIIRRNALL